MHLVDNGMTVHQNFQFELLVYIITTILKKLWKVFLKKTKSWIDMIASNNCLGTEQSHM